VPTAIAEAVALSGPVVLDASVAAKWLVPEGGTAEAVALLNDPDIELHAPELMDAELCNVLWKRVRRGQLTVAEAVKLCDLVQEIPADRHRHTALLDATLQIALRAGVSCYDALYVALAESLNGTLATADLELATRLRTADSAVRLHVIQPGDNTA
jgi:predicted nucleic acid-binding protein